MNIDISLFNDLVKDAIKNGRIQKFEYFSELTWKIIKRYLLLIHGIETKSPKQVIKEFYTVEKISESDYETLLDMIDDRNRLSHIYKEEFFEEILLKLPEYLIVMDKISEIIDIK